MAFRWFGISSWCLLAAACVNSAGPSAQPAAPEQPASSAQAQTPAAAAPAEPAAATTKAVVPGDDAGNPFLGATFYVNPDYKKKVEGSAAKAGKDGALLRKAAAYPTAVWLDSIAETKTIARHLEAAKAQQKASGKPVVSVFVVYDLPNRDCSAKSSAGELSLEANGEARYKTEFIDVIAAQFKAHPDQRIVAIVEPDSLGNLATNMNVPKCAASAQAYRSSIAYAISTLALPNVSLYIDAAHGGWLGWDGNRETIGKIYKEVLLAAGGVDKIRGFATNVSNYNVTSGDDGKRMEPATPTPDELTYVSKLAQTLANLDINGKGFIIDTGRNGKGGIRKTWGNWCNIKGAGLGERPVAKPAPGVDAYYWVKPPGDSDGTSDPKATRFDENCRSQDAAPNAPEAGKWFHDYFRELVLNANPPL